MSNEFTPEQARATAERIMERLLNDEAFRDSVSADPKRALEEAGVPANVIGDFLEGLVGSAEVSGYAGNVFHLAFSPAADHPPLPQTYTEKCWCDLLFKSKPITF